MQTTEEIRIKAGLDYSKVIAGFTDIRGQLYKLASDVPKKLGSLLKANVYMAASDAVSKLTEIGTDWLIKLFGQDETGKQIRLKALQDIQDFSRKTVAEFQKASAAFEEAQKKFQERGMSTEDKLAAARAESEKIREEIARKQKQLSDLNLAREGYRPGQMGFSYDEANKLAIEQKAVQAEILNLKTRMLQVDAAAAELNKKAMGDIGRRYWQGQEAKQASKLDALKGLESAAGAVGGIPGIGGTIAQALAAQAEAMKNIPQAVKIVSVES